MSLLVLAMTLIVIVLFVSSVYVDMNNAVKKADAVTDRAIEEINKLRSVRQQITQER